MPVVHGVVEGRVQGVGYRQWATRTARRLGLVGWVRNCTNRTVEVVAAGEEAALRQLMAQLKRGPILARVAQVACHWLPQDHLAALTCVPLQAFQVAEDASEPLAMHGMQAVHEGAPAQAAARKGRL